MASRRSIHENSYELRSRTINNDQNQSFSSFRGQETGEDEQKSGENSPNEEENFSDREEKNQFSSHPPSENETQEWTLGKCSFGFPDAHHHDEQWYIYFKFVNFVTLVGLLIMAGLVFWVVIPQKLKFEEENRFENFETRLNEMKKLYPKQNPKSWTRIKAAVRSFFQEPEKRDQSVMILLISDDQSKMSSFADSLIDVLSMTSFSKLNQSNLTIDVQNFEPLDLMFQFGHLVLKFYDSRKSPLFYQIRSIENLKNQTPLIFHRFCDDEKFKNSVFILNLKCENLGAEKKIWDEMAEECLKRRWLDQNLDLDRISPLLSRIANTVIYVL